MSVMASQITSLTIVYSTVYSGAGQRKHQSSASLAFVWGIHRWPVNSTHNWPVTRKMFSFDDVFMNTHTCLCFGLLRLLSECIIHVVLLLHILPDGFAGTGCNRAIRPAVASETTLKEINWLKLVFAQQKQNTNIANSVHNSWGVCICFICKGSWKYRWFVQIQGIRLVCCWKEGYEM